ncbi:transposase [Geosporobacter subterraneus]|uniref:transposase n=1 Tax=Geosporobacter subterraneus TaxID=390806 RepID=UPI00241D3369|nr:transposase [Geosporobacter subterraneus]
MDSPFCSDLKAIYGAATRREVEDAFEVLCEHWMEKYPLAVRICENNLDKVLCLYDFPGEIRHIIYTTNAIESYHSSLRKVINIKAAFPNDEAVYKLFYLRTMNIVSKWNRAIPNWSKVLNQLVILFGDKITKFLP